MKVRYEDRALVQIEAIHDWYAPLLGDANARTIVGELFDRCDTLAEFPRRGSPRDDIRPGVRTIPHRGMFTIGYRVDGDIVTILGVTGRGQSLDALVGG